MSFNSYTFIIFFTIVLLIHNLPLAWRWRKVNLLAASYVFYAAWNPPYVLLLVLTTVVDWFVAKRLDTQTDGTCRKALLCISLASNLGMLVFFKYSAFLLDNLIQLLALMHIQFSPPKLDLILPLGISFFTFQSLTYTIDTYRRKSKAWHSFLDYALFVSFFPKVVIGPITRAFDFLQQCNAPRKVDSSVISWGFFLLLLGLFEKIVMADSFLAPIADQVFDKSGIPDLLSAWTAALAYTGQIFFDFAGYSTCAIGVALCLGFNLPTNFRFPYAAMGFSDFWRRWHISLSQWLRDYLYISIGGNKRGELRTYVNLMITMLLGGLWHGASWTFILWGGLHGSYLVIERVIKSVIPDSAKLSSIPLKIGYSLLTFLGVCVAWVVFRASSLQSAMNVLKGMFAVGSSGDGMVKVELLYVLMTFAIMFVVLASHWIMRDRPFRETIESMPMEVRLAAIAVLFIAICTCSGDDRAFIYFQF